MMSTDPFFWNGDLDPGPLFILLCDTFPDPDPNSLPDPLSIPNLFYI